MVRVEALLAHEQWVRRLARALIGDEDEADDVMQETRLAWWRRPPREAERTRSWLGTVVRNAVRNRRRGQGARQRLEGQLPAADVPSAEQLAERLEIHRRLAEAVAGLAEPYRQVVLLRYYEELTCAEIARRLGEPAGTIRWRLKTGLERLRAALDEARGRTAWLAALAPLVEGRSAVRPHAWPGLLAIGVVGLGVAGVLIARGERSGGAAVTTSTVSAGPAHSGPPRLRPLALATPGALADAVPAWIQLEGLPGRSIAGRVVSNGRPIRDARVRLSSGTLPAARRLDRHAISSTDGTFSFADQPITDWFLSVWAPGLEPAIHYLDLRQATTSSRVAGHPIDALLIELVPCRVFARGTVRDAGGGVLASARVRQGSAWEGGGTEARTDGRGSYQLCLASGPQARVLTAEADGYGAVEARALLETGTVDFVLEPQSVVAGRAVRKATGDPVAGVEVALHPVPAAVPVQSAGERRHPAIRQGRTDAAGRFELAGVAPGRYTLRLASDQAFGALEEVLAIGPGEQRRGLEVRLSPVAVLDGVALRQGVPAAHAELRFAPSAAGPASPGPRRTRADQQGRFRVRVPGDVQLAVETLVDPAAPNEWKPVLAPASARLDRPEQQGLRIELPPAFSPADLGAFVSSPGTPAPPPGHVLEGRFGDQVRLLGYDLSSDRVARGGDLEVTLHFQVTGALEGCRLFAHLVGPGGFTNLDHAPAGGAHPVPRWRAGEIIRDRFPIRIPASTPPGRYTLLAGFWRPAGNQRLIVDPPARDDGEGRFRVLTFSVD